MKEKIAAFEASKATLATVAEKPMKQPRKAKKDAEFLDDKVLLVAGRATGCLPDSCLLACRVCHPTTISTTTPSTMPMGQPMARPSPSAHGLLSAKLSALQRGVQKRAAMRRQTPRRRKSEGFR